MAVMTDPEREEAWRNFIRERFLSDGTTKIQWGDLTKQDIRAAVNALDQYFSDNEVAINNTLPAAAKAGLTKAQKALLLQHVICKRYLTGV